MVQRRLDIDLPSVDVPQHRHLSDLFTFVRHVAHLGPLPKLEKRHIGYCRQACRVLGWVDAQDRLTAAGLAVVEGVDDTSRRMNVVATAMASTHVYQCWMRWEGVASLEELEPSRAREFLLACTDLKPSTARHRAGAMRRWLEDAVPRQASLPGLAAAPAPAAAGIAPHNENPERVSKTLGLDIQAAKDLHLLTGYASLDRLILALADTRVDVDRIRLHIGAEIFPGRPQPRNERPARLEQEVREFWLRRGVSLLNARRWLRGVERLEGDHVDARIGAQDGRMVHAKATLTDSAVVMGSSNFTRGGLERNHEINARWTDVDAEHAVAVRALSESLWNRGMPFLDQLRQLARDLLRVVTWKEALARACAAILEGAWAQDLLPLEDLADLSPPFWPHQRDGLASVLWLFEVVGLVLVADPAGSGKTRLGAWAFRVVHQRIAQERGLPRNPIIVCPKAVRKSWREYLREAGLSVVVFSDTALSRPDSVEGRDLARALERTDLVLLDEAHRYLNATSARTRRLLSAGPEHLLAFTATPLNRDAGDFWGLMELLGADHFDDPVVGAVEKIRRATSLKDVGTEIETVRAAFQGCLVRRTRSELVQRARRNPEGYRLPSGRVATYPAITSEWYTLPLKKEDERLLTEIRELAAELTGMHRFVSKLARSKKQKKLGWGEDRYLRGTAASAAALARYDIFKMLRSSRVAAYSHIRGVKAAKDCFRIRSKRKLTGGNALATIRRRSGKPPTWAMSSPASSFDWLPAWMIDSDAHAEASAKEAHHYQQIADRIAQLSDAREQAKAELLKKLAATTRVLAFDHHVFTLVEMQERLSRMGCDPDLITGADDGRARADVLRDYGLGGRGEGLALLSDAMNVGVNLQGASVVVHLDWPTVIRVAEQRTGRIDRMDSEHDQVRSLWPRERGQLALDASEVRLFRRNELLRATIGANLVLPDEPEELQAGGAHAFAGKPPEPNAQDASSPVSEFVDAFAPVRRLVGPRGLVSQRVYDTVAKVETDVAACVSVVASEHPWAFFCVRTLGPGAPQWVVFPRDGVQPIVGLRACAEDLRMRLSAERCDHALDDAAGEWLKRFATELDLHRAALLPPRDQHVLEVVGEVLNEYAQRDHRNVERRKAIEALQRRLEPGEECGDLRKAARALTRLLVPYRLRHLEERTRRSKLLRMAVLRPHLLDDPLPTAALRKLADDLEPTAPPSQRVASVIVGVPAGGG